MKKEEIRCKETLNLKQKYDGVSLTLFLYNLLLPFLCLKMSRVIYNAFSKIICYNVQINLIDDPSNPLEITVKEGYLSKQRQAPQNKICG